MGQLNTLIGGPLRRRDRRKPSVIASRFRYERYAPMPPSYDCCGRTTTNDPRFVALGLSTPRSIPVLDYWSIYRAAPRYAVKVGRAWVPLWTDNAQMLVDLIQFFLQPDGECSLSLTKNGLKHMQHGRGVRASEAKLYREANLQQCVVCVRWFCRRRDNVCSISCSEKAKEIDE
jgi:hypothetical protein